MEQATMIITRGFTCGRCKKEFSAVTPRFRNGTGTYCFPCRDEIFAKARTASQAALAAKRGRCSWCGESTVGQFRENGSANNVCRVCTEARVWLLKVIRHSGKAAKYVADREASEGPARVLREAEEAATQVQALCVEPSASQAPPPAANDEMTQRMDRIESLVLKLADAWGVGR